MIAALAADDLTGASDSAVQFARAGWEATLLLGSRAAGGTIDPDQDALLAVTADNRAMRPDAAKEAALAAVGAVQRLGARRLFVKVDSTMRGSAAAHVSGALEAWRRQVPDAVAVVCPAYPGMGRRVQADVVLVDGVPVAESAFRRDPVTPMTSSVLAELLPGSVPLARFGASSDAEALERALHAARRAGGGMFTADASTDADLQRLADAIGRTGGAVVPVGSAGLAAAMAPIWRPAGRAGSSGPATAALPPGRVTPALVQVTSLHEASRRQLAALQRRYGERCLSLSPDLSTLANPTVLDRWFELRSAGYQDYDLVVLSVPADRAAHSNPSTGQLVAERLGTLTARLLSTGHFGVAGFVGGDGARAALASLDVPALRIVGSLEDGVPVSTLVDRDAPDTVVFTKAGGFGSPESLVSVLARLAPFPVRRSNA